MVLDLRRTAVAASDLACWRAVNKHQLPPADRACCADAEPVGRLST